MVSKAHAISIAVHLGWTALALTVGHFALAADTAPKMDRDGKTLWYDARELVMDGRGWTQTESPYTRLPVRAKGKVTEPVWELSHNSAGLCIRFTTDAASINVRWTVASPELAPAKGTMSAVGFSGLDLYTELPNRQWQFVQSAPPTALNTTVMIPTLSGSSYLLYLPLYNTVRSLEIGVPTGHSLSQPAMDRRHRNSIVVYGTSITQGGCASRPGMSYSAIVGRRLDAEIINLGFSAAGRMEPAMADLLGELDPTVYVLDCT
jgi:hypothetical protein